MERFSQFNEGFIKNFDKNSDEGYILVVDIEYSKYLFNLQIDLPLLAERNKINKCKKLFCNIRNIENYVLHIRALKKGIESSINTKKRTQSNSI